MVVVKYRKQLSPLRQKNQRRKFRITETKDLDEGSVADEAQVTEGDTAHLMQACPSSGDH